RGGPPPPAAGSRKPPRRRGPAGPARPGGERRLRSRLMIGRVGALVAFGALALSGTRPAPAAPAQQPPPPQRVLVVGDSTAETMYPFLRDAGAGHGIEVESAARIGCSVIDGDPKLDDGRPYVDIYGDTSQCTAI